MLPSNVKLASAFNVPDVSDPVIILLLPLLFIVVLEPPPPADAHPRAPLPSVFNT